MREQARRTKSTRAFLTKRVTQTRLIPRSVSIVYRFRVHSFYFQLLLLLLLLSVFSLFVSTIYSSRRRVFCRHHVFLMLLLYPASSSSPVPLVRIRALRAVRTPAVCRKTKKDRKKETRRHVLAKRFVSEKRDASDFAYKENARKLKKKNNKKKKKKNNNNRRRQSRWKIQNRASRAPRCFSISAISLPPRVKNTDQVIFHTLSNAVETTTILLLLLLLLLLLFSIARRDQHSIKIRGVLTCRNTSLDKKGKENRCVLRSVL